MPFRSPRTAVVAAALLGGATAVQATASWLATASGTGTVTTGTWSVVVTEATAAPWPTGPLTVEVRKSRPVYVTIANAGTLAVTSAVLTASAAAPVTLEVCPTGWDRRRDTCAGGAVTVPLGVPTSVVPTAPGSTLDARLGTSANRVTVTVGAQADRSAVRPPTTSSA